MGRGTLSFKHTDIVRAVRAVQAAGLVVCRTEIYPDGRIVLYHQLERPGLEPPEESYEEWKVRTGAARDTVAADNSPSLPDVFTPETLAAFWGCSEAHIRKLIRSGELRAFRIGPKLVRVRSDEASAFQMRVAARSSTVSTN